MQLHVRPAGVAGWQSDMDMILGMVLDMVAESQSDDEGFFVSTV